VTWLLRRFIGPFIVGSIICATLLLVWAIGAADAEPALRLSDVALALLFIAPFEAIGLVLLLPFALSLPNLSVSDPVYALLLIAVGAALGAVVVLPIADDAPLLD
jgi:hypothetical protein